MATPARSMRPGPVRPTRGCVLLRAGGPGLSGVPAGHPTTGRRRPRGRGPRPGSAGRPAGSGRRRRTRAAPRGLDRPARDDRQRAVQVAVHVGHRRHEGPRVGVPGAAGEVGGGQVLHDAARVHDQHPVADLADHGHVVADEQDGDPVASRIDCSSCEHLLLDGDVEGGGRLVGDDQGRAAHEAHADHGPLPQAARELVRVLAGASLGRRHVDGAQPVDGAGARLRAAHAQVVATHLGELAAHPPGGVERGPRVLEDHRQRGAQEVAHARAPCRRAGRCPGSAGGRRSRSPGSSMSRATASAVSDLPEPDSPTTPTASPGSIAEGHAPDRLDGALLRREGHRQVPHVEHRLAWPATGRPSASSASRLRRPASAADRPVAAGRVAAGRRAVQRGRCRSPWRWPRRRG